MKLLTVSALLCAVMALTTAAACPKDWTPVNRKCYIYEPKNLTYAEAQKNCQSMGARLATVHRRKQSKLLVKIVSEGIGAKSPDIWLGGSDRMKFAIRKLNVRTPVKFRNWCPGHPNRSPGDQDCLNMHLEAKCLQFSSCGAALPSVCTKRN